MNSERWELAQYKFILLSIIFFIVYGFLPSEYVTFKNITNTIASLLLITGFVDLFLKKDYLEDLSKRIIGGFFADKKHIKDLPATMLIGNISNMLDVLSDRLHPDIKEKFRNRVLKYFINIFDDSDNEKVHTFYKDYHLKIRIDNNATDQNYCIGTYELSYTLINNSNKQIKHSVFKKRGFDKEQYKELEYDDIISIESFKYKTDNKNEVIVDTNTLNVNEIEIPTDSTANNQEKFMVLVVENEENKEFILKFNNKIEISKKIKLKIPVDDILYKCHFNRISVNTKITYIDKTSRNIHVLNAFAFIEKNDIIMEDIDIDTKQITVKDLIFPKDAISFISER